MVIEGKDQDFEKFLDVMGAKQETPAPTTEEPAEGAETVAPSTDAPAEPETAAPSTDAPAEFETEAPATEAPVEGEDEEDDGIPIPEDPVAAYKQMVKLINEGQFPGQPKPAAPAEPKPKEDEAPAATQAKPSETKEVNYLEGVDYEELTENPEAFNAFLNKFAQAIEGRAVADAQERVLRTLPDTLLKFNTYQTTLHEAAKDFYKENPDLQHVKPFCAQVANGLAAEHPDWTIERVFKETGPKVKQALGLQAQARKGVRKVKTPVPQGKGARPGPKPKLTPMQKEINDILASGD